MLDIVVGIVGVVNLMSAVMSRSVYVLHAHDARACSSCSAPTKRDIPTSELAAYWLTSILVCRFAWLCQNLKPKRYGWVASTQHTTK
jgi:hypothetical protein